MTKSISNVILVNPIIWNIVKGKPTLTEGFPLLKNVKQISENA